MSNPLVLVVDEDYHRRISLRDDFLTSLTPEERTARSNGNYFSSMDVVWRIEQATIQDDWFASIQRSEAQGNFLYGATTADDNFSHPMSQSDSSSLSNTPTQRVSRFDMLQNATAKKAHLFPDSPVCHKAYGHLAQAATGKIVTDPNDRLKLLNGIKKIGSARRSTGCGLKHHKYNKMYLERQHDFFDSDPPKLILIPVLDLGQVLNWNGTEEYEIMAITVGGIPGRECSEKILEAAPLTCNEADVRKATELLRHFCKAIACSNRIHPVEESFTQDQLNSREPPVTGLKKWAMLLNNLRGPGAKVELPQMLPDIDWDKVKVAKAKASRDNSLPDPFLVAVKAGINLSAILQAKLMPACPEPDSDESSSDGEINSIQDDSHWSQNERVEDFPSLVRSFGHPVI